MLGTLPMAFLLDPIHALPQGLQLGIHFGFQLLALGTVGSLRDPLRFQRLQPIIEGAVQLLSLLFGLFPQFRGQETGPMGFLTGLCWLLGSSVQKSEIFGGMISLSDQTAP